MPRESVAFVILMGLGFGTLWGGLSLSLWSADERVAGFVIAPLWFTFVTGSQLAIHPYLLAGAICAMLGLIAAAAFLAIARARGA